MLFSGTIELSVLKPWSQSRPRRRQLQHGCKGLSTMQRIFLFLQPLQAGKRWDRYGLPPSPVPGSGRGIFATQTRSDCGWRYCSLVRGEREVKKNGKQFDLRALPTPGESGAGKSSSQKRESLRGAGKSACCLLFSVYCSVNDTTIHTIATARPIAHQEDCTYPTNAVNKMVVCSEGRRGLKKHLLALLFVCKLSSPTYKNTISQRHRLHYRHVRDSYSPFANHQGRCCR